MRFRGFLGGLRAAKGEPKDMPAIGGEMSLSCIHPFTKEQSRRRIGILLGSQHHKRSMVP
ncbi:hypothetical protein CDL12_23526 [Handroanthus impetiginosus]|uniref:Uncharacterized protein n=1 Tax=Handroanthus impetiginosus TaxID=429701 RepID=A0A2G9GF75_9LAMI|nr:hypothetical protein CDL12_23526 [Handroanthus impetiginosus]